MKPNRFPLCTTLALASLLSPLSANADDPAAVEERLKKLESSVEALSKENTALRKELGWDGKSQLTVAKPAGKETKLAIGGYFQGQAEAGKEPDLRFAGIEDRFFVRRARLNVSGNFLEHFNFKLEGDFAGTLSESTDLRFQLTDGFIHWNRYEFANVKVGQFKTPFGHEQLTADTKTLMIERSLANDRLTDSRQIGLGVSGDFLKKRLGYSAGIFNGSAVNNSYNDNNDFLYAARVTGAPVVTQWGKQEVKWNVGLNGLHSNDRDVSKPGYGFDSAPPAPANNLFDGQRTSLGVDTHLQIGRFGMDVEYLFAHFDVDNGIPSSTLDSDGFQVTGSYLVVPKRLKLLTRYEWYDSNLDLQDTTTESVTFGADYLIKGDDIKLQVNYLLGDPAGPDGWQGRLLGRLQLAF